MGKIFGFFVPNNFSDIKGKTTKKFLSFYLINQDKLVTITNSLNSGF